MRNSVLWQNTHWSIVKRTTTQISLYGFLNMPERVVSVFERITTRFRIVTESQKPERVVVGFFAE